jgi:hypothetical protein
VVFLIISNFVTASVITGTDVGSTLKIDWRAKTCQIRGKLNSLMSKLIAELTYRMKIDNVERLDGRNLCPSRLWYSPILDENSANSENQGGIPLGCGSYRNHDPSYCHG